MNQISSNEKKKPKMVCNLDDNSCETILLAHTIAKDIFEPTDDKPLEKTWESILSLIKDYQYQFYVSFEIDKKTNDILDLILVSKFVLNPPCYSAPLFRCIAASHKLRADSVFTFFNAIIKDQSIIVIEIKDNDKNVFYYDIANDPE